MDVEWLREQLVKRERKAAQPSGLAKSGRGFGPQISAEDEREQGELLREALGSMRSAWSPEARDPKAAGVRTSRFQILDH